MKLQQNDEVIQKWKKECNSGKSNSSNIDIDMILYRINKAKDNQELE